MQAASTPRPPSPTGWPRTFRLKPYRQWLIEQPAGQDALVRIEALLTGAESAQAAARGIGASYGPVVAEDPWCGSYGCDFWAIFCEAVRDFGGSPTHSERLAELLRHVAALPDATTPDRIDDGSVFWRDLPGFTFTFREFAVPEVWGDIFRERSNQSPDTDWYPSLTKVLNAIEFAATLAEHAGFEEVLQHTTETALAVALEHPLTDAEEDVGSAVLMMGAACMSLSARSVYRWCYADSQATQPAPDSLWIGMGFFPLRWQYWKRGFQGFADATHCTHIDDRSRAAAIQAAEDMRSVEQTPNL